MKNKPNKFDVAFMLYAPIDNKIILGDYEIIPFYDFSAKLIKDKVILGQIQNYFSRFFEYKYDRKENCGLDEKIKSISIIIPNGFTIGVDELTKNQKFDIFSLSHIIAFSAIFENQIGFTSSDPFKAYIQNFTSGREGLSIYNQYYTRYDLYKFLKPLYIMNPIIAFYKTPLCECLASALKYRNTDTTVRKILRSLELIFYTVTYEEMTNNERKILSLLIAFEVLLGFKGKVGFANEIEKYITDKKPTLIDRNLKNSKGIEEVHTRSKTAWWAFDLYILRNQIVHAQQPDWKLKEYGSIMTRIDFSGNLFKRLFKILLSESKLMEDNVFDNILEAYDMDKKLEELMTEFIEFNPNI